MARHHLHSSCAVLWGLCALGWCICSHWQPFVHKATDAGPLYWKVLVGIAAGVVTFLWPGAATLALLIIIGAWALVTGIFEIVAAIRLREEIEGEWLLLISGLLSVLFGIAIAIWPAAGLVAVTWMIGAYSIVFGILLMVLGFRLRNWGKQPPELPV